MPRICLSPSNSYIRSSSQPTFDRKGEIPQENAKEIESEHTFVERLGRERPSSFKTSLAETAFVYSILASQFMAVSIFRRRYGIKKNYES